MKDLNYFKQALLTHLTKLEKKEKELQKSRGYSVGTIREWKGQKYIKGNDSKWRRYYSGESRGAKMAIAAIKRKINNATSEEELMKIILDNSSRFRDEDGNVLPLVLELYENVKKNKTATTSVSNTNTKKDKEYISTPSFGKTPDEESIIKKYLNGKFIIGDDDEIQIGKELIVGKWKLVEADMPATSHDSNTFYKTKGFPINKDGSTINDRDYEKDLDAQSSVRGIAAEFDGRALLFDSPIVVSQDGVVISGNNRTMSSKIATNLGTDKDYIIALKKKAKKFGFSSSDLSSFNHPRVVFEIQNEEEYSTEQFAKFNQSSTKSQNPIEKAVKIAKTIQTATIKNIAEKITEYDTVGELYSSKRSCEEIFNTLQQANIIQQVDRSQYITPDGGITGAGKEFLETVLIGSAINEKNIRGLNRDGCKNIRRKLVRAIVPLINNKAMGDYSVSNELNEAIDIMMQVNISKNFSTVDEFAQQQNLFEPAENVPVQFAKKLEMKEKDFADFMQSMNASLEPGANSQFDIFLGGVESKEDILKHFLNVRKSRCNQSFAIGSIRYFFRTGRKYIKCVDGLWRPLNRAKFSLKVESVG